MVIFWFNIRDIRFTNKESTELITIDIELPVYVKYYILNDGDYSDLLVSKDFRTPEDLETTESELLEDEKEILKKIKKTLYGGAKKKQAKKSKNNKKK